MIMNFPMLAGLETFAVNIIVALICLERRFNLVIMLLASLILGLCSALIMPGLTRFDPEHSLGLVFTIAFLLPSLLLYRDQLRKKVLVFATVWIFTFAVESTAELVPRLLFGDGRPIEWLRPVIQLALFLITTPFVIKFIRCEFALLMSRLSRKYFNILVSCTDVAWHALSGETAVAERPTGHRQHGLLYYSVSSYFSGLSPAGHAVRGRPQGLMAGKGGQI